MRTLWRWLQGGIVASLLIWGFGYFVLSDMPVFQWHEGIADWVEMNATPRRNTDEGWGYVMNDKNGIAGLDRDASKDAEYIVVWGDSFVEASQVPQENTVYSVIDANLPKNVHCIGIGRSERSIQDYLHLIPKYSTILPTITHNFILIDVPDIEPPNSYEPNVAFDEQFVFNTIPMSPIVLRNLITDFHLNSFWAMQQKSESTLRTFRLFPRLQTAIPDEPKEDILENDERDLAYYDILSNKAAEIESMYGDVTVVFNSPFPMLENGEVITEDLNNDRRRITLFRESLESHNIDTLDLRDRFVQYYEETGKFPRGFANTFPGLGHWNRAGHELAAEAIIDYYNSSIQEDRNTEDKNK